jgi:hypothetical protein
MSELDQNMPRAVVHLGFELLLNCPCVRLDEVFQADF